MEKTTGDARIMELQEWIAKEKEKLLKYLIKFDVVDEDVNSIKSVTTYPIENHPLLRFRIHLEIYNPTHPENLEEENKDKDEDK